MDTRNAVERRSLPQSPSVTAPSSEGAKRERAFSQLTPLRQRLILRLFAPITPVYVPIKALNVPIKTHKNPIKEQLL